MCSPIPYSCRCGGCCSCFSFVALWISSPSILKYNLGCCPPLKCYNGPKTKRDIDLPSNRHWVSVLHHQELLCESLSSVFSSYGFLLSEPFFRVSESALLCDGLQWCTFIVKRRGRSRVENYSKTFKCYPGNVCSALKMGRSRILRGGVKERMWSEL